MLQVVLAILESEETSAGPPEAVHEAATAERPGYDVSIVFGFVFTMYEMETIVTNLGVYLKQ